MRISVIIPTYNRRALLSRALSSVFSQVGAEFEVIVVDDGSIDGTAAMIKTQFPKVIYRFLSSNQGPAAARNRGLEIASGEWIAFLDSDDTWHPEKLKRQKDFLISNPDYLICQTDEIWIRKGVRVNPMNKHKKSGGWVFEKCLPLCMISPSAVMIHRSLLDKIGLFDESFPACEDYDLWLRVASQYPVGFVPEALVTKYGGHDDQRSHEFPAMDRFRIEALLKILTSGKLNNEQILSVLKTLKEKAKIYIQGALKRRKTLEAQTMEAKIKHALELSRLSETINL